MAQLLKQWMNRVHKSEAQSCQEPCRSQSADCDNIPLRGQAETMRQVLMQINQLRHF
ncbi:MAG: hypothetical protein JO218_05225 [Burkholderiales bacterium]|nr:hypothetical protein [Burkholderiales bacterium]